MLLRNTIQFFKLKPVVAVGFLFATSSLLVAVWASALPFIKLRLGLNDSQLGLLLLFAPLGSIVGVLTSTTVFSKIKIGNWLGMGNLAQCTLFCLEVYSPNVIWFSGALFLRGYFGFLNGVAKAEPLEQLTRPYFSVLKSKVYIKYWACTLWLPLLSFRFDRFTSSTTILYTQNLALSCQTKVSWACRLFVW
jgi:hypothetical protein